MTRRKGVMLCYPWEAKRLDKWPKPYVVQPKYKGIRCKAYVLERGSVSLLSSEGNLIETVPEIKHAIEKANLRPGTVLDGELYIHGLSQGSINSVILRSKELHPKHLNVGFEIFDVSNINMLLRDRLQIVELLVNSIDSSKVKAVPSYFAESLEHIMDLLQEMKFKHHYEGIVVKNYLSLYEEKRSTNWMKWKPGEIDTYRIIGSLEEISIHGEPKNSLGALVCINESGEQFKVGSGFTREQRQIFWYHRELLVGMKVTIAYQELTNRGVPEHPVMVSLTD